MINRVTWIVGLLSLSLLGFELALMRMLSYAQWYHFAYMIISVALLGFGASGTFLSLLHSFLDRQKEFFLSVCTLLCVFLLVLTPLFLSVISIDPFLLISEPVQGWRLLLLYLAGFLPFFFGALVIGLSFLLFPEHVGRIYFSNMVGSGVGSLCAVVLMNWVHPNSLPFIMALIALPAAWLAFVDLGRLKFTFVAVATILAAIVVVLPQPRLQMSQFKSLSRELLLPDARVLQRKISPLGVLEVVESPAIRYAPGLSLSYPGHIPSMLDVFLDGERIGAIADMRDSSFLGSFRYTASSLPYFLKKDPSVLVVGSGTGNDIQMAKYFGAERVTGLEMNAAVIELLERNFQDRAKDLAHQKNVAVINIEARSFLSRERKQYDLIVVPILEGMTAAAAGTQALFENYLFTVESFTSMLDRMAPQGILAVSVWMTFPPRGSLKTIALIIQSLRNSGVASPGDHLAVIRGWSTVTVLAKKQPWTQQEVDSIRAFCQRLSFDVVHVPGIRKEETNRYTQLEREYLYESTQALLRGDSDYAESYPFYIEPATDEKPYFGHFFKWKSLSYLRDTYGPGRFTFFELSYFLLLVTFAQLAIVSLLLIILPVAVRSGVHFSAGSLWRTVLYFGGIGLGYMFVEIVMIQKFILFLGHPIYSVSTIIAAMLVFSGIGSYCSSKLSEKYARIHSLAFTGIVVTLILYAASLSPLLRFFLSLQFPWRVMICILLLSPLAFFMGFPFPLGIRRISEKSTSLIPWAWGVNGYFSVISASLATLVAMDLGFTAVFVFSVVAYSAAAVVSSRFQPPAHMA